MTNEPVQPTFAPLEPTGALAYGLGFLAYIPVPFFNLLIAGIVMAAVGRSQRKKSGIAAENGRHAANWGLTLLSTFVVMIVLGVVLGILFSGTEYGSLLLIPVVLYLVISIAHVILIIVGLVKANKHTVFDNRLAIPYLR